MMLGEASIRSSYRRIRRTLIEDIEAELCSRCANGAENVRELKVEGRAVWRLKDEDIVHAVNHAIPALNGYDRNDKSQVGEPSVVGHLLSMAVNESASPMS